MSQSDFRKFIPTPEQAKVHGETARDHAKKMMERPVIQGIFAEWNKLLEEPFRGITTDGKLITNLFRLRSEKAPSEKAIIAANRLLERLTKEQIHSCCFELNSKQWRNWQNTEIYIENYGLRLCELTIPTRENVIEILKICLSAKGFEKTRNVMRLNGFLGDLLNSSDILGEFTYLFCLFGKPTLSEPWGWQLFGHHLSFNCIILKDQITLTPTFMGAEPSLADSGRFKGIGLFNDEEKCGLELMQSLSIEQQKQARVAHSLVGGDLPQGRRSHHDGLQLSGAYCDNRIIPLEGLPGSKFKRRQKQDLIDLIAEYMSTLPKGPFEAKMEDIERHLAETHFCWIGGERENEPFYYRIQSPVTLIEFDHHAGVFLTNSKPENFHIHTLVRTPNGNDYGMDLIRQHYKNSPHHKNNLVDK